MAERMSCSDHPDEMIRFVCKLCDKLICRDCKLTEHEGHTSTDLRKAADEARERIAIASSQVDIYLASVRSSLEQIEGNAREFESSVQVAKEAMEMKLENMITYINKLRVELMSRMTKVESEGRSHYESARLLFEEKHAYLLQIKESADGPDNDFGVLEKDKWFKENGPGKNSFIDDVEEIRPKHRLDIFLNGTDKADYQKAMNSYVGSPLLAQISTNSTTHMVLPEFWCTKQSECKVKAIYPVKDGQVVVAYSLDEEAGTRVAVYARDGTKQLEKLLEFPGNVVMARLSSDMLHIASHTGEKRTMMDLGQGSSASDRYSMHYLRANGPGKYKVLQNLQGQRETALFEVFADDPISLSVNESGDYFAILQMNKQIAIFRKGESIKTDTFIAYVDNFQPRDICFHVINGKEMLLVADTGNNIVYIVNHHDRCRLIGPLVSGCPMIAAPTALTSDNSAKRLWVGCKGGQILTVRHAAADSHEDEEAYEKPVFLPPPDENGSVGSKPRAAHRHRFSAAAYTSPATFAEKQEKVDQALKRSQTERTVSETHLVEKPVVSRFSVNLPTEKVLLPILKRDAKKGKPPKPLPKPK
ncbi:hypothetical protein BaRGS_00017018 [Batillaria attramentaria]|uniref:B box-type domain-containing protein n=1 Tax=Batillaria attramentaria TaxID=370345 RepID=A0ABD0KX12_9CAEN